MRRNFTLKDFLFISDWSDDDIVIRVKGYSGEYALDEFYDNGFDDRDQITFIGQLYGTSKILIEVE